MLWISFITSAAAFITALLSFFTLFEMKKQRKTSLKPALYFENGVFHTYWFQPKKELPIYWSKFSTSEPFNNSSILSSHNSFNNVTLECSNIGYGVAKNILLKWSFNINSFIDIFLHLNNNNHIKISKVGSDLMFYIDELKYLSLINKNILEHDINFINPISHNNDATFPIVLPFEYINLITILLYLNQVDSNKSINPKHFPSLTLKIDFLDIDNDKYTNSYKIHPFFHSAYTYDNKNKWHELSEITFKVNEM